MERLFLFGVFAIFIIGIIIVTIIMLPRVRKYSKIFNSNHYSEIHLKIEGVKSAALNNIENDVNAPPIKKDDPRALITKAGLAILYTITTADDKYEHHISVSCYRGYTPHAVGEHFVLYIADIMSWDIPKAYFFFTKLPVFHAVIELQAEEQFVWEKKVAVKPEVEKKDDLRKRILKLREQTQFQLVDLPVGEGSQNP